MFEEIEDNYEIGKRVNELRKERKLSIKALSEIAPMSESQMGKLLKGQRSWKKRDIEILAKFFVVSEEYILYGENYIEKEIHNEADMDEMLHMFLIHAEGQPKEIQKRIGKCLWNFLLKLWDNM